MTLTVETTETDLDALREALDRARRSAKFVTVPRQAFAHLLLDHGRLYGAVGGRVTITHAQASP